MTIRNQSRFSNWRFHIETPTGSELVLSDTTLPRLVETVIAQLAQFDAAKPGHTKEAREEAKSLGYDWERYIGLAIQHQICMRMGGVVKGLCWSGVGDKIHNFMKGIDKAVEMSGPLRLVGQVLTSAATRLATGKTSRRFGGCATCGGRKTFSGSERNLGRVAYINHPNG